MKTFLVNVRGRVVGVENTDIVEKRKEGWDILPPKYITDKGTPKQWYFPQYDRDLVGKPIPLDADDEKRKEVLNVEIL